MFEFKYEIRLNDQDRPYIHLPDNYDNNVEDRFMALEIARYVLYDISENKKGTLPQEFVKDLVNACNIVGQLSDKLADLIKGQMDVLEQVKSTIKKHYNLEVPNITTRNNIPYNLRTEDIKVLVLEDQKIYRLKGGIGNSHWVEIEE